MRWREEEREGEAGGREGEGGGEGRGGGGGGGGGRGGGGAIQTTSRPWMTHPYRRDSALKKRWEGWQENSRERGKVERLTWSYVGHSIMTGCRL